MNALLFFLIMTVWLIWTAWSISTRIRETITLYGEGVTEPYRYARMTMSSTLAGMGAVVIAYSGYKFLDAELIHAALVGGFLWVAFTMVMPLLYPFFDRAVPESVTTPVNPPIVQEGARYWRLYTRLLGVIVSSWGFFITIPLLVLLFQGEAVCR